MKKKRYNSLKEMLADLNIDNPVLFDLNIEDEMIEQYLQQEKEFNNLFGYNDENEKK
jgi:hypothetical protein